MIATKDRDSVLKKSRKLFKTEIGWKYYYVLRIFDVRSEELVFECAYDGYIESVSFSPDGRLIATGSDDEVLRIFNVESKELVFKYEHDGPVYSLSFSPDSRLIATGSGDKLLRVFKYTFLES